MEKVRNEVMVQKKLYKKQDTSSTVSHNEGENAKNITTEPMAKTVSAKPVSQPKMINNDTPLQAPDDKSMMSTESIKTTMSQSKITDTDSQTSQSNVMLKAKIKRTDRIFVPNKKRVEEIKEPAESVNIEILLEKRKVQRTIRLMTSPEAPKNEPYILATTKDGRTLILPLDVDALAKQINDEVDPSQNLAWDIRCYIIELIQYAIFKNNLFS